MGRIVDIKEPLIQLFMADIAALSVVEHDRYQRKQSAELKRKRGEAVKLFQVKQRLQRDRCQRKEGNHLPGIAPIIAEEDDRPRGNQIRPPSCTYVRP